MLCKFQAWANCAPDAGREARPMICVCAFCFVKKKKTLDLQISSQIEKTMKMLY